MRVDLSSRIAHSICLSPAALGQENKVIPIVPPQPDPKHPPPKEPVQPTCDCDDYTSDGSTKISEGEAELVIAFENELHNTIYVK